MSDLWEDRHLTTPEISREFLVSVDLYVSNSAWALLRKPLADRKKGDKRGQPHLEEVKFKDKAPAHGLGLQKSLNAAGHWRSATCKLIEEGERCLLNIYVDESILFQTVIIHLLNQTDIRQTDQSLFYRKDCLSIFCIAGQRWTSSNVAEPVYLQFANTDTCLTWQALLKSYAIPEIYGRWFYPMDGGSYRMWRQVELTVIQGRNLGLIRHDTTPNDSSDNEGSDVDISCEIHLNDILCSRTTVKRGLGGPDWHENFVFPGLPPFETLDIVVWKEKKLVKPAHVGTTRIPLINFRRGDTVEGWFPVLQTGTNGNEFQYGELRLKIRVDEEIILPYSSYKKLMQTCESRSLLDWMTDLENRLKLKNISSQLISIAVATDVVIEQIQTYASREVENSTTSHHTLFRGNTTLTKTIELCMAWYGKAFLEASIGTVLRRLCAEKVAIEVDPMRSGKGAKSVERNVELLIYWCQEFWNQIYSVRGECPNEMRRLFETIRRLVERRYQPDPTSADTQNLLPWQSVSAFCFLRFIVPAILHPHLFGLCPGLPSLPVQRSLTLIAKVIQSLANLNTGIQKEIFMRGVQDFLKESLPAMIDYIDVVSSDTIIPKSQNATEMDRHERLSIVNSFRQRKKTMTTLDRDSILNLPHCVDLPRHLAVITSSVIRGSRALGTRPRTGDDTDLAVDEFISRCFEVEEEAIFRVSQLATKLASEGGRRQGAVVVGDAVSEPLDRQMPRSPINQVSSTVVATNPRPTVTRRRKSSRPSTAPSPISNWSHQEMLPSNENAPESQRRLGPKEGETWDDSSLIHNKSPSIDSFPQRVIRDAHLPRLPPSTEIPAADGDDPSKRKKGILRGILRR